MGACESPVIADSHRAHHLCAGRTHFGLSCGWESHPHPKTPGSSSGIARVCGHSRAAGGRRRKRRLAWKMVVSMYWVTSVLVLVTHLDLHRAADCPAWVAEHLSVAKEMDQRALANTLERREEREGMSLAWVGLQWQAFSLQLHHRATFSQPISLLFFLPHSSLSTPRRSPGSPKTSIFTFFKPSAI